MADVPGRAALVRLVLGAALSGVNPKNLALCLTGGVTIGSLVGFVTLSGGSLIAIQGFASLGNIGVEAFTGFFAALVNVRIAAPTSRILSLTSG